MQHFVVFKWADSVAEKSDFASFWLQISNILHIIAKQICSAVFAWVIEELQNLKERVLFMHLRC